MKNEMLVSIREATRLVQTRGPAEATVAIQRALQATAPADGVATYERKTSRLSRPALTAPVASPPPLNASMPLSSSGGRKAALPGGEFLSGSFTNKAGARNYKLYVPSEYRGQALPLVVMLHGCGQNPDDFAAGTRMNLAADLKPCFVLYPAQAQRANSGGCWNWFTSGHQKRDRGEPSIIADMTRELIERYDIDRRRTYVAGLSAGGAMASVMGTTYPDLFAAIGVHSGLAYGAAQDLTSALEAMRGRARAPAAGDRREVKPVIVFHGDADTTVHPRNGAEVVAQGLPEKDAAVSAQRPVVRRGQAPNGHSFTRTLYHDHVGRVVAEHWVVHGGVHGWSGGSREGSHVEPKGPDATREMLRFFSDWAQTA